MLHPRSEGTKITRIAYSLDLARVGCAFVLNFDLFCRFVLHGRMTNGHRLPLQDNHCHTTSKSACRGGHCCRRKSLPFMILRRTPSKIATPPHIRAGRPAERRRMAIFCGIRLPLTYNSAVLSSPPKMRRNRWFSKPREALRQNVPVPFSLSIVNEKNSGRSLFPRIDFRLTLHFLYRYSPTRRHHHRHR
jgi:hypothetical protein